MEEISPAAFKSLAQSKGLELSDEESERVRALTEAALALMQPVHDALSDDSEPIVPGAAP